jgi:hypothetical protein
MKNNELLTQTEKRFSEDGGNFKFPKTEKIEIRLRQDLADRLPAEKREKNTFINQAIEYKLNGIASAASLMGKKGGAMISKTKAESSRKNGKRGGRPKKTNM